MKTEEGCGIRPALGEGAGFPRCAPPPPPLPFLSAGEAPLTEDKTVPCGGWWSGRACTAAHPTAPHPCLAGFFSAGASCESEE